MARKILITGASGFVGRHLAQLLCDQGYEVFGLDQAAPAGLPKGCHLIEVNLGDPSSLADLPKEWFGVIHLAGASIPSAFSSVAPLVSNLHLTLNLLEHLHSSRVLLVSSCHVYGPSEHPHKETDPLLPMGRYGLSKHLIEQVASHYQGELDIRIVRPFNHLGPGQRPELVIPTLLRNLTSHSADDSMPVLMQGQNSVRDFIDVQDVVSAYQQVLELEAPEHRLFNVCTGRPCSIEEVVKTALDLVGSKRAIAFSARPNSQDDVQSLVGDPTRLHAIGWKAGVSLGESLSNMLSNLH